MAVDAAQLSELKSRRDKKLAVVIGPARAAWVIEVKALPHISTLLFDLIYRPNPSGGWYRRRYEYDGEADILHHRGEVSFPEAEIKTLPEEAEFKI